MLPVNLIATDIQDAWFQALREVQEKGFKYVIQHGSYIGQTRMEFDHFTCLIKKPYAFPYDLMLPKMPEGSTTPPPVANGYIEQYMPYLMTDHIEPGEQYTYGSRMFKQIPHWINVLKETPNTNQAVLQIGRDDDYKLPDPPCLRHIDMRIKDGRLIFYPYFRSWDLWGGFPANLAGLAVLQESMASEIGVEPGPMFVASKGLHIYGYVEELAKIRIGK